jgi:cytochrome b subunit of formate dehydrogenase
METYQQISVSVLLITILGIILTYMIKPDVESWKHPVRSVFRVLTLAFIEQKHSFAGAIRKLVYLFALFSFIILAITGFYPTLIKGEHISGWLIMIHATFAPVLAVCLAVIAVMWAGKCRLNNKDWPWFSRLVEQATLVRTQNDEADNNKGLLQKIGFWLIVLLSLPLILSITLSMLPYFGTDWQEIFLFIHRYTALVFAIVVLIHTHLIIRAQLKQ